MFQTVVLWLNRHSTVDLALLHSMQPIIRTLLIGLSLTFVAACASNKNKVMTDKEYYDAAQEAMKDHNYQTAITKLQDLESHYPVGPYTEQAQLELVYAQFKHLDYASAAAAAEHYIRLHPSSPQLDYVYYAKGLANFEGNQGVFDRYLPIHSAWRDMTGSHEAFNDFKEVVARYPNSPYAPDARAHMLFIRNQQAEEEMHVARYYARRGAYIAAVNRAKNVVEGYSSTPSAPEALAILSFCYDRLNQPELAASSLALLKSNYPDFKGYDKQGHIVLDLGPRNDRRSWLNIITFGLLGSADIDS